MSENHRLPSEELAAFVAGYPYESIPQSVLRENRRRILDTLGVAIGARKPARSRSCRTSPASWAVTRRPAYRTRPRDLGDQRGAALRGDVARA